MRILWLSWKDEKNPQAGGAEVVSSELRSRLASAGHEVILLTRSFTDAPAEETINGYKIVRLGNEHTVYLKARAYYKKNLVGWADLIVEEINTMPFFTPFYAKEKKILFFHQLCREIWFYQMGKILGLIGWLLEPLYLFALSRQKAVTVSRSTQKDLCRYGFKGENISIISEGIELKPIADLQKIEKFPHPTLLSLGAVRPMKRTDHIIKAFELAKKKIPELELVIAGNDQGSFGAKVKRRVLASHHQDSIKVLGQVSREKKIELMQKSHLIAVTSVKEGWGLIVTEANSQGTPAVVYNVDGLRDSVKNRITGWISNRNSPLGLARKIREALSSPKRYATVRQNAWRWSKEINFEKSFDDLMAIIEK